ncbi:MAG: hypothetical protein K9N21_05300 [Deltaproteobacteria bacterium]|nr:hypothetical protein [Deltaproteobacteria bacterium]
MKEKSMSTLFIFAGILGIAATLWSGFEAGQGPFRIGEAGISATTRYPIMILALAGGTGAVLTGLTIKVFSRWILGIASLVFAVLMVPSVFQENTLSILPVILITLVGIALLAEPLREPQISLIE